MARPAMSIPHPGYPLDNYELLDRYRRESGRVFLTGTLVTMLIRLVTSSHCTWTFVATGR